MPATLVYSVTGNTWPVRWKLKQLGCFWNAKLKTWQTDNEETYRAAQACVPISYAGGRQKLLGEAPAADEDEIPSPPAPPAPAELPQSRPAVEPPAPPTIPDGPRRHFMFPIVHACCQARIPVYLCGPAGSFKSSTASAAAEALALPFYSTSVCAQTTKADLLGFIDAGGTYRGTAFRKSFEHGGIFLLDEIDAGNPNTIAVLNAALANGHMTFPDGEVAKHADFVLIAAANTFGCATTEYVGRNQLDAATLDRFAVVHFPYDEPMELSLVGCYQESPALDLREGGAIDPVDWAAWIIRVRAAVAALKLRIVITPRASLYGAKLAKAGIGRAWLERLFVWKLLDESTKAKIAAQVGGK